MLHKLERTQIKILTKCRAFLQKKQTGFYFGGVAARADWYINAISGVMSASCGLRWGRAGWLWAVDSLAVGWRCGGLEERGGITWPEVDSTSSAGFLYGQSHITRWEKSTQKTNSVGSTYENDHHHRLMCTVLNIWPINLHKWWKNNITVFS